MKGVQTMQDTIKKYLEQVKVGRKQSFKNLAVYPLQEGETGGERQLSHPLSLFARATPMK